MSRELERAAISKDFNDLWDTSQDGDIAWPNKPFQTPLNNRFVVFNLVDRGTVRRSLGRSFFKRNFGSMQIDLYTPQDKGTSRSKELIDMLEQHYEMLELPLADGEIIIFQTPSARTLDLNVIRATNLDDNWDRLVFDAPFYRDSHVEK